MKSSGAFFVVLTSATLFYACSKGGNAALDAEDAEGRVAFDEDGQELPCPPPRTDCESVEEASLTFQDRCQLAGHRVQLCACKELCSGSTAGAKHGYTAQNKKKECTTPKEDCQAPETSAAFQDGCNEAGYRLVECGCEWLCEGKLKEPLPEPAPEPAEGEAKEGEGEDKQDAKTDKKDKKEE